MFSSPGRTDPDPLTFPYETDAPISFSPLSMTPGSPNPSCIEEPRTGHSIPFHLLLQAFLLIQLSDKTY